MNAITPLNKVSANVFFTTCVVTEHNKPIFCGNKAECYDAFPLLATLEDNVTYPSGGLTLRTGIPIMPYTGAALNLALETLELDQMFVALASTPGLNNTTPQYLRIVNTLWNGKPNPEPWRWRIVDHLYRHVFPEYTREDIQRMELGDAS